MFNVSMNGVCHIMCNIIHYAHFPADVARSEHLCLLANGLMDIVFAGRNRSSSDFFPRPRCQQSNHGPDWYSWLPGLPRESPRDETSRSIITTTERLMPIPAS